MSKPRSELRIIAEEVEEREIMEKDEVILSKDIYEDKKMSKNNMMKSPENICDNIQMVRSFPAIKYINIASYVGPEYNLIIFQSMSWRHCIFSVFSGLFFVAFCR